MAVANALRHGEARVAQRNALLDCRGEPREVVAELARELAQRGGLPHVARGRFQRFDGAGERLLIGAERGEGCVAFLHVGGGKQRRCDGGDRGAGLGQPHRGAHGREVGLGDAAERAADIVVGDDRHRACRDGQESDTAEGGEQLAADADAGCPDRLGRARIHA